MEVVFLNPPSLLHDTHDLAPPLWTLLLGSLAERLGLTPRIIDLNLEVVDGQAPHDDSDFYTWATNRILENDPAIVCYSSMALNGHVALKLSELVKSARPSVLQFFGGPHFSAIAEELLRFYPWVDAVFIGEAERSLAGCFQELLAGREFSALSIPGMLTRSSTSKRSPPTPLASEDIPPPAYHLADISRYLKRNPRRLLDFEAGRRGCIYSCRYCYAPQHFGRGERASSTDRFIKEMAAAAALGAKHLFIVTDNFVNYPHLTAALCDEIAAARLGVTFNCYATLAQLDAQVVPALARAGCTSVYVGVDAVHPEARREFAKGLFRSRDDLLSRIDLCLSHNITPNLAFLLEEPEKGEKRFYDTVATALAGAIRGCPIAFNTLTVYPRTRLALEGKWNFVPSDLKARICFDAPEVVLSNPYSLEHPELFPFHSSHRPHDTNGKLLMYAHALKTLSGCAAEAAYDICESGSLLECLDLLLEDMPAAEFAMMDPLERRRLVIGHFLRLCENGAVPIPSAL